MSPHLNATSPFNLATDGVVVRQLAGGGAIQLDYTVFAMAVLTMGLLLIVEVIRHGIDRMAQGHDFFETVLKTVYHELSTLGLVEAIIFLAHHYYPDLNLEKERIFADVHFTLFFVAIINALMSCIIYSIASRVAKNRWTKLEVLNTNHYVAFRQQFAQVTKKMEDLEEDDKHKYDPAYQREKKLKQQRESFQDNPNKDNFITFVGSALNQPSNMWFGQANLLRNLLKKKHAELLVQLRFHELRVHFIETHSLKANFKVSDYLKLAMNDVFKAFVHVSTTTWLALLALTNFIYFSMGIITYTLTEKLDQKSSSSYTSTISNVAYVAAEDPSSSYEKQANDPVPIVLTWMYISYCILFMILSYLISLKMENIFTTIIQQESWIKVVRSKELIERVSVDGECKIDDGETNEDIDNIENQQDLFWFGKPDLIITIAQLFQFSFSVGFAILLVFSKTVRSGNVFEWWGWYFVSPIFCFTLFVWIWGVIIPEYTQCTSLGEMVNRKHLVELDALSKLDEQRSVRHEQIDYIMAENDVSDYMTSRTNTSRNRRKHLQRANTNEDSLQLIAEFVKTPTQELKTKNVSTGVSQMRLDGANDKGLSTHSSPLPRGSEQLTFSSNKQQSMPIEIDRDVPTTKSESITLTTKSESIISGDSCNDEKVHTDEEITKNEGFESKVRSFFLSPTYRQSSAVFGTLIAAYFLSFRINLFLIETCHMEDKDNIWYFFLELPNVFWILISMFCAFMLESLLIIVLFLREEGQEHFSMVIAGLLDMAVISVSTAIFIFAEYSRCHQCSGDTVYGSAGANAAFGNESSYGSETTYTCTIKTELLCCPTFGSRLYGGLGPIEPFTALIALRLLRFFISQRLVRRKNNSTDLTHDINHSEHHAKEFDQVNGNIAQLWILALSKYSDVVQRHGMFSANLLETMLGIDPLPQGYEHMTTKLDAGKDTFLSSGGSFDRPNAPLIRSMRRCNFKLLPLVHDHWQLVDVALTEHEIVWFNVSIDTSKLSESHKVLMLSVKDKMKANNGGKSLRLCEVAFGRTVIGRLSLSDLQQASVQRIREMSFDQKQKTNSIEIDIENLKYDGLLRSEYWSSNSGTLFEDSNKNNAELAKDWFDHHSTQDRLKLKTEDQGTLFLQFAADMNHEETAAGFFNGEDDEENIALLWCHTMIHLRGMFKLRQNLPRLGKKDEWKDLVELIDSHDIKDDNADDAGLLLRFSRFLGGNT